MEPIGVSEHEPLNPATLILEHVRGITKDAPEIVLHQPDNPVKNREFTAHERSGAAGRTIVGETVLVNGTVSDGRSHLRATSVLPDEEGAPNPLRHILKNNPAVPPSLVSLMLDVEGIIIAQNSDKSWEMHVIAAGEDKKTPFIFPVEIPAEQARNFGGDGLPYDRIGDFMTEKTTPLDLSSQTNLLASLQHDLPR